MRVAITGEKGFLGIHMINYLRQILKYDVVELGKEYLGELSKVKNLDWLIHGACTHRHDIPEMVLLLNREITNKTITCLKDNNIRCNIVFLSSIQEDNDSFYGQSKREAKEQFENYCRERNLDFISYRLPNIFGKYAKPNRTSFIATFCCNLFNNIQCKHNRNSVELIFVDEVVEKVCSFKEQEMGITSTTVESVYTLLASYKVLFDKNIFPKLENKFEFDLYQTFLSYKNYKI